MLTAHIFASFVMNIIISFELCGMGVEGTVLFIEIMFNDLDKQQSKYSNLASSHILMTGQVFAIQDLLSIFDERKSVSSDFQTKEKQDIPVF